MRSSAAPRGPSRAAWRVRKTCFCRDWLEAASARCRVLGCRAGRVECQSGSPAATGKRSNTGRDGRRVGPRGTDWSFQLGCGPDARNDAGHAAGQAEGSIHCDLGPGGVHHRVCTNRCESRSRQPRTPRFAPRRSSIASVRCRHTTETARSGTSRTRPRAAGDDAAAARRLCRQFRLLARREDAGLDRSRRRALLGSRHRCAGARSSGTGRSESRRGGGVFSGWRENGHRLFQRPGEALGPSHGRGDVPSPVSTTAGCSTSPSRPTARLWPRPLPRIR